jgi:tetratricopeptide (TPR) repeat protein
LSDHKDYLIAQSEKVVDLQIKLEQARALDDRDTCEQLFVELEKIGDDLTGLNSSLNGDDLAYSNFVLGSICALMGLWPHAEQAYEQALSHWPDHVGLLNEMAECQFELGNFAKAADSLEKSLKTGGHTPVLIHDLAVAYAWNGDIHKARITLINGMARFPQEASLTEALREIEMANSQ